MAELPPEIQFFHILPRLPAKSVLRFMCVSKQWHSFLKTREFTKMHLCHVTNNDEHQKLLFLISNTPSEFHTIDCEAPEDSLTACRSSLSLLFEEAMQIIMTSFHGLVCVGIQNKRDFRQYTDLILWNPLTGEHKTLSKANSSEECYNSIFQRAFGLYYHSSEDDYKLLSVSYNGDGDAYIYSLKFDSWRKVDSTAGIPVRVWGKDEHYWGSGVLLNEKLYFLIDKATAPWGKFIMSFNIETERFKEIPTPPLTNSSVYILSGLVVVRGCIYLYLFREASPTWCPTIELWRMNGDGYWTNLVSCYRVPCIPMSRESLHFLKDGHLLMPCYLGNYISKVDLEGKHVEVKYSCAYSLHDISPQLKYIETFVSPNQ